MKAVQISRYGGNDVLEITQDAPNPSPIKGQVLVEVYAVGVNPVDWKVRAGYFKETIPLTKPVTLGGDFSGVVAGVGGSASDLKVGDAVYGYASILSGGSGSFAEFVAANTGTVARTPKVNFVEAAALPLAGVGALQALEEHIKLQRGHKILVHGGAGGIGSIAIQIAKSAGAYVATTVSGDDRAYVKGLGADEVIDYKQEAFEERLKDFDAVFDTVGGETTERSFKVLKKGGMLVSMLGQPNPELARRYGVTAIGQMTHTNTKRLNRLVQDVDSGNVEAQIYKVFPLDNAKEAFKLLGEGHPRGKVVLDVKRS
ncbi:MAG: NADPH:quinone reductase [Nitrospiraceae bacterium]